MTPGSKPGRRGGDTETVVCFEIRVLEGEGTVVSFRKILEHLFDLFSQHDEGARLDGIRQEREALTVTVKRNEVGGVLGRLASVLSMEGGTSAEPKAEPKKGRAPRSKRKSTRNILAQAS
ncbi:hypothetical protein COY07_02960 [Candidatus Peregrinibacteria bacterium CG_4_10_14_0_2_um_filter_43_11]|nr:MAG: hypothetical protein COY07_02960 [Candidatus Peregrinibacteria bacterium CG_4_10_14_0_2_um_filter_43_11]